LYISQAFAEIRHFRKCLVISGNDWAIEEFPELPRHLQKYQAFAEVFVYFVIYFTYFEFWEKTYP
jgi:hypothetical protein